MTDTRATGNDLSDLEAIRGIADHVWEANHPAAIPAFRAISGLCDEVERLRAAITGIADKYDRDYEPDDDDDHPLTILDFNHGEDYAHWMAGVAVNEIARQAAAALAVGAGQDTSNV